MPFLSRVVQTAMRAAARSAMQPQPHTAAIPHRPAGMCAAQKIDFKAAREGKITWQQYFAMWGALSL
jgi:hypothetical protein